MTIIITFSFSPFTSFLSVCLSVCLSVSLQLRNDSNYNHRDTVRGSLVLLSHRRRSCHLNMSARVYVITGTWHTRYSLMINKSSWGKPLINRCGFDTLMNYDTVKFLIYISGCACIPTVKKHALISKGVLIIIFHKAQSHISMVFGLVF